MTGIVLWNDSDQVQTDAISLEYSYMRYSDVVTRQGVYDFSGVDRLLDQIAARKHQAVLRFYYVYPGYETTVPQWIKRRSDYHETVGNSEGSRTVFPDWSNATLKQFTLDFYSAFARRYDNDPRLAFLEVGFGLWAEYHIYDGPLLLGRTFPDKAYQKRFANHLASQFLKTPWMISVDAANSQWSPYSQDPTMLDLKFGVFDDSFLNENHAAENEPNWNAMRRDRWMRAPCGGELSYFTDADQRDALAVNGPHGESFESAARRFHVSFMIGNDQPDYTTLDRIKAAGLACGYRFRVTQFQTNGKRCRATVTNTGIAPIYHDAYFAISGVRSATSLKGLLPGQTIRLSVESTLARGPLVIASDRLVPGQSIEFEANLR